MHYFICKARTATQRTCVVSVILIHREDEEAKQINSRKRISTPLHLVLYRDQLGNTYRSEIADNMYTLRVTAGAVVSTASRKMRPTRMALSQMSRRGQFKSSGQRFTSQGYGQLKYVRRIQ